AFSFHFCRRSGGYLLSSSSINLAHASQSQRPLSNPRHSLSSIPSLLLGPAFPAERMCAAFPDLTGLLPSKAALTVRRRQSGLLHMNATLSRNCLITVSEKVSTLSSS